MAQIILNKTKEVKGLLIASRKLTDEGNIVISGELLTHRYIEHIYEIETERYLFNDVVVHSEEFASNDAMIRYEFFAKSMEIKGCEIGGSNETNLPRYILDEIEKEYFKSEQEELIHKEVYTKWKSEIKN